MLNHQLSDALEKRKCLDMGSETPSEQNIAYELRIETDENNKKLVFTDTGLWFIL